VSLAVVSLLPLTLLKLNFLMYLFIINLFEMLETGSYVIFRKKGINPVAFVVASSSLLKLPVLVNSTGT